MKCVVLTMLVMLSCTESLERRHPKAAETLRQELDDSTRAWLLMVESGKVDDEKLRRITPKSVFIAPMLSGRAEHCKEGYRRDHLGHCVKIIKIDPNLQLEFLLKRLSAIYSEVKQEEKAEKGVSEPSSGPLQFSIPILDVETTPKSVKPEGNLTSVITEELPAPLAMTTHNSTSSDHVEGSGSGAGPTDDSTEAVELLTSDDDFTPTLPTTTDAPLEYSGDDVFNTTEEVYTTTDQSYQSTTEVDETTTVLPEGTSTVRVLNRVRFPEPAADLPHREERPLVPQGVPERLKEPGRLVEPPLLPQRLEVDVPHQEEERPPVPQQEFWWVPQNWQVDEDQHRSTLLKFWSRFPLVRDASFVDPPAAEEFAQHHRPPADQPLEGQFTPSQHHAEPFRPSSPVHDIPLGLTPPPQPPASSNFARRGRFFGSRERFYPDEVHSRSR